MSSNKEARWENFVSFIKALGLSLLIITGLSVIFTIWGDALKLFFPSSIGGKPMPYAVMPGISLYLVGFVMTLTAYTAANGTGRAALFFFFLVPVVNVIFAIAEVNMTGDLANSYMIGSSFIVMMYCYIRMGIGIDAKAPIFMNFFMPIIIYFLTTLVLTLISLGSPVATLVVSIALAVISFVVTIIVRVKMGSVVDEYR